MLERDPDERIRRRAASLLGVIKDRDATPDLARAVDDADSEVGIEAIRALGACGVSVGSEPIIDRLLSALNADETEELRAASIETLDSLARDQERVARAIAAAASGDASARVRRRAVDLIQQPTFAFQVPALIAALEDSDPQVRLSAGTNLASIGLSDDRVVPALCNAALKSDDVTREGMAMSFGQLNFARTNEKTAPDEAARRFQLAIPQLAQSWKLGKPSPASL